MADRHDTQARRFRFILEGFGNRLDETVRTIRYVIDSIERLSHEHPDLGGADTTELAVKAAELAQAANRAAARLSALPHTATHRDGPDGVLPGPAVIYLPTERNT